MGLITTARRHPFLWVVWIATPITLGVFAWAGWNLLADPRPVVDFGWTQRREGASWYVGAVAPAGPAAGVLQAGDRLLSMNGDPNVAAAGTTYYRSPLRVGDSYRLSVVRNGETRDLVLGTRRATGARATRVPWILEAILWSSVALFIGFARPSHPVARVAFAGALLNGVLYFLQAGFFRGTVGLLPIYPLHVVLGYHFFYRFPGGVRSGRGWTILLAALYAGGLAAAGLQAVGNWTYHLGGPAAATALVARNAALFAARVPLSWWVYFGGVAAMIAVIPRNYRLLPDPNRRRRVRWVVYGSAVGLSPMLVQASTLVYQMVFRVPVDLSPVFMLVWNAGPAAVPITVAYVMVKHRVFDTDFVIRRGIQYLLAKRALQILLLLPAAALVYAVLTGRDRTIEQLITENSAYMYWIGAAGLSLRFRNPLRLWLDRKFFRDQYDREQILAGLIDELGSLEAMPAVFQLVSSQLDRALHPKAIHLWYRERGALAVAYSSAGATAQALPPSVRLLSAIDRAGTVVSVPFPRESGLSGEDERWLTQLDVHLVVPIRDRRGWTVGVLMLGEKRSEEPYSSRDRQLLQSVARQLAIVDETLRLEAQVGEAERIRIEVLGHLGPDLVNVLKDCPVCGTCFDGAVERCDRDGQVLRLSLPVPPRIDERYVLARRIGEGGMGAVFEARDLRLDRTVAVKVMLGHQVDLETALRRFQREARTVASLNHPNIVSVYDFGRLEHRGAYLVMEHVQGTTLRTELERDGSLSPWLVAAWFEQLLAGIAAAHEAGVVHRDLKPENIISERDRGGALTVKVLDFGIAKLKQAQDDATRTLTQTGIAIGTVGYMAPEQLLGEEIDHRADIFALGVMLVESLTGRRPFGGDTYAEALRSTLLDSYHLPAEPPGIQRLDALVQRCLAKKPGERLDSATRLRADLVPLLRGLAVADSSASAR